MSHFNTLEEYQAKLDTINKQKLIEKAENMATWAVPSHESTGYTQSELVSIIYQLVRALKKTL